MKRIWIVIIVVALLLTGCASRMAATPAPAYDEGFVAGMGGGAAPMPAQAERSMVMDKSVAAPGAQSVTLNYASADALNTTQSPAQERLVIKNADLSIVVTDPSKKMDAISKMAEEMGGWVVSSNVYQTQTVNNVEVQEGTIAIRVPAEKLDEALGNIKKDAVDVLSESSSGQDVTAEYVDLQSRLKTYEEADAQLSKILETKTESEEVLAVFQQKIAYEEQINLLKGQIKYYQEAAAMSAINVRVVAEESIQPLEIGGWKPQGVARDAAQALINFFKGFVNFLIWLIIFILPMLVLIALPIWGIFLGIRAIVRAARRKKPAAG
jgi:hypothetical protein